MGVIYVKRATKLRLYVGSLPARLARRSNMLIRKALILRGDKSIGQSDEVRHVTDLVIAFDEEVRAVCASGRTPFKHRKMTVMMHDEAVGLNRHMHRICNRCCDKNMKEAFIKASLYNGC